MHLNFLLEHSARAHRIKNWLVKEISTSVLLAFTTITPGLVCSFFLLHVFIRLMRFSQVYFPLNEILDG